MKSWFKHQAFTVVLGGNKKWNMGPSPGGPAEAQAWLTSTHALPRGLLGSCTWAALQT